MRRILFTAMIVALIILSACAPQPRMERSKLDDFARCLTAQGMKMYGSFQCSVCARERKLFGSAFRHIEEIECHPRGDHPQTERCMRMDVMKTPTWIIEHDGEEVKRLEGYQSIDSLAEATGCTCAADNGSCAISDN